MEDAALKDYLAKSLVFQERMALSVDNIRLQLIELTRWLHLLSEMQQGQNKDVDAMRREWDRHMDNLRLLVPTFPGFRDEQRVPYKVELPT